MAGRTYPSESLYGPGWKQVSDAEWATLEDDDEYEDVEEEVSMRTLCTPKKGVLLMRDVLCLALRDHGSGDIRLADSINASDRVSAGGEYELRISSKSKDLIGNTVGPTGIRYAKTLAEDRESRLSWYARSADRQRDPFPHAKRSVRNQHRPRSDVHA